MFSSSPKCYDCRHFSTWDMASGGTVARCAIRAEVEQLIRTDLRLWNVTGNWASSFEAVELPACEADEEAAGYICDEDDAAAAAQDWLDSQLIRIADTDRPVFRSVKSIEEDILWKFSRCDDYAAAPIENRFDDPILYAGRSFPRNPRHLNAVSRAETLFLQQAIAGLDDLAL